MHDTIEQALPLCTNLAPIWKIARGDSIEALDDIPADGESGQIEFSKGQLYQVLEMFPLKGAISVRNNDGVPTIVDEVAIAGFIHHRAKRTRRDTVY